MPCRDDRDETEVLRQSVYVDRLTAWLCELCSRYLTPDQVDGVEGLSEWWGHHQKRDAIRKKRELDRAQQQEDRERAELERLHKKYGPPHG